MLNTVQVYFVTVVSTALFGRIYCGRICAFGAFTQLMDAVLPKRLRVDPPKWLEKRLNDGNAVDFGADFSEALPGTRPVENDEALVREYFLRHFESSANMRDSAVPRFEEFSEFTNYVRASWLKPIFAEAMITFFKGNEE